MTSAPPPSDGVDLPDFDRPPVIEVVLGVEFQPVQNLGAASLTHLADGWAERYPHLEEMPALPPSPLPGSPVDLSGMVVSVGAPAIRLWRLSEARDHLLQIQRDRLVLNWQRQEARYPHYDQLRPPFRDAFEDLMAFVSREGLGVVRPTTAEVTYVNRLDQDSAGVTALQQTIRAGSLPPSERLASPAILRINQAWNRDHDGRRAVLTVTADSTPVGGAILSLSYRVALLSSFQVDDVLAALDRGHAEIVTTFLDVTKPEMHARWGRRR